MIWDPTVTRLTISPAGVKVGEAFTVILEKLDGASAAPGQTLLFSGSAKMTDQSGQTIFTAASAGVYKVTANTTDNLIRPVSVLVTVTGDGTGGGSEGGGTTPTPDPVGQFCIGGVQRLTDQALQAGAVITVRQCPVNAFTSIIANLQASSFLLASH